MRPFVPNVDLIKKYDRQGPRYTSYPTALKFSDAVNREELCQDIIRGRSPISLYFHIPFCETLCWFCGCFTEITKDQSRADNYLDYIEKEISLMGPMLDKDRRVCQLHLGGGTPNFLSSEQLERLAGLIRGQFNLEENSENSVELDPRRLSHQQVKTLRETGFGRASFGVQDCNLEVQKVINRIQPHEQNIEVMGWLREEGFNSINIDLIYGLPLQTVESFEETLDLVLQLDPDRFAIFSYAHVPWMKPSQKLLEDAGLPSPAIKLQLLKCCIEKLTAAGYVYVGMDHFAKPDDELVVAQNNGSLQRNFQGYSTRGGTDVLALGVSSISQTDRTYRQNFKSFTEYAAAIDGGELPIDRGYILTHDDQIRRHVIMRLMCDCKLNFESLSQSLDISFAEYFAPELDSFDEMKADGLLTVDDNVLKVSPMGRLLIRNIAMHFDAYRDSREKRFSRTV